MSTSYVNPGLYTMTPEEVIELVECLMQVPDDVGVFDHEDAECLWCGARLQRGRWKVDGYERMCQHEENCAWALARTFLHKEETVRKHVDEVHQSIKRALER